MELRNCPECGRLFTYITNYLCPNCKQQDDNDFQNVKDFLAKHPRISIFELSEATEVEESKIFRWVREGRIEGKQYPGLAVPCEGCGRPITQGRYCQKCSDDLIKGFGSYNSKAQDPKENDPNKPKFHTRN